MRKITIVVVLAAIVAAGGGLYLGVLRPLLAVSDTLPLAEQALATPDAVLLAGINVKQAAFLERWFIGAPPATAPKGPTAAQSGDLSLLDHLQAAHVDPRRDVDYVLLAAYPGPAETVGRAIALTGRFDPAAVNGYLANTLHGKRLAIAKPESYEVTLTDPASCQPTGTWVVTVDANWILIADAASHEALLARLTSPTERNDGELDWWRPLARADLLSIGVRNPARLGSATATPMLKSAAQEIAIKADAFQRVYIGFRIKPMPPEGQLRLVIDAKDEARATEQIATWQRAIGESRERWATAMPSVAALYDSLSVHSEGARNTAEVTVGRAAIANVQRIVGEALAGVLGGFGVNATMQATSPDAERIDTTPAKFEAAVDAAQLAPYDPAVQFAEKVDRIGGPFGMRLEEIKQDAAADAGLDFVIAGYANGIPNVAANAERARLFVDSVKSTSGQELLKVEACGRGRNGEPANFAESSAPRLRATKTLHLIAGAEQHGVQRIDGHVELRLPTRTETIRIAHPTADSAIEKYGVTVRVTKLAGGSVSYEVTGARDRLLLLRALNAKGQPLDRSMMVSGDFLFGDGSQGQSEYRGAIDALDIVLAAEEQTLTYPFTLTDFSLAEEGRSSARDEAPEFQPYDEKALRRDYATPRRGHGDDWKTLPPPEKPQPRLGVTQLEPFELSFDKALSFYALKLDFGVRGPNAATFFRRFNVGQMRLTQIALKDGSVLTPPTGQDAATAFAPKWSAPVRFMSTPKQGVLGTTVDLLIDSKAKPEELRSVAGTLDVQFPQKIETLRLDDLSVGQRAHWQDVTISVVARSRQGVSFHVNKDANRIVYIRLLNAQGEALAFFGPQVTNLPDGSTRFELSPFNPPARAQIVLASEIESKSLPFSFALP
jgi:hypothetical protein